MMPAALALAVLVVGVLAAVRAQGAAGSSIASIQRASILGGADELQPAGSVDVVGDLAESVFSAGAAVLENFGAVVSRAFELPAAAAPYADAIGRAESARGLPPGLLGRVLYQESGFRPEIINGARRSSAGALGIAQFMPGTAADLGIDPLDPFAAIDGAARYLREQFDRFGDWSLALAAYNWGPRNVARRGLKAAPLETRNYVSEISWDVGLDS